MPRARRKATRRTVPTWRYEPHRGVLYVYGESFHYDLEYVWELIQTDQVPFPHEAIVHTLSEVPVPMLITGNYLSEWLVDRTCPDWIWHFKTQAMKRSA